MTPVADAVPVQGRMVNTLRLGPGQRQGAASIGKVHRIHDDGRIPADDPFVGRPEAMPSVWSHGHRNPQGLALHDHHDPHGEGRSRAAGALLDAVDRFLDWTNDILVSSLAAEERLGEEPLGVYKGPMGARPAHPARSTW